MAGELVTVFGGSGFVGRYVVRALCKAGHRVRVAVRNPHVAGDVKLAGDVGQVQLIQANVRNVPSIERALDGAWGCINLVGILYEKGKQTFDGTQEAGSRNVAEVARDKGVTKFVHMSALGANAESKSAYARTKAEAEEAVRAAIPGAVVVRPSIVFGPEDGFFNRFAEMAKLAPALPAIGGGKTRFQPVYVGDVAEAIVNALSIGAAEGRTFELGGPQAYTFKELLQYILKEIDRPRLLAPLPFMMAKAMGYTFGATFKVLPFSPPLTADQVELLKTDNVVGQDSDVSLGTITDLGVTELETVEAITPTYLWQYRPQGQFHETRPTEG